MKILRWMAALALATCVAGCGWNQVTVMTGPRTSADWGTLKVYGTDKVPFEYEEIGFHSLLIDTADQQYAVRTFASQVQNMGADAVLGFQMLPLYTGGSIFGFGWEDTTQYVLSGVVVKIKQP